VEAQREKYLYLLNINVWKENANVAKFSNEETKWDEMVNDMNLKEIPLHHVCERCIEGNHQRTSFPKYGVMKVLKLSKIVHTLCVG
jgi:hypothetical protein